MSGRYASSRDQLLDELCIASWAHKSYGDVSDYGKHFAFITFNESDRKEVTELLSDDFTLGDPPITFDQILGNFVVIEDTQGFVTVDEHDTYESAKQKFVQMRDEYYKWLENTADEEAAL